jgi:hypothetical protein
MTPPNYFRFVKKEDAGGGGGGLPDQEYRHRLANVTGLTEVGTGTSSWSHGTATINGEADVPWIRPGPYRHLFYFEIDDTSAINATFNSDAFTIALWWLQDDGNHYSRRWGAETGALALYSSGTNIHTKFAGTTQTHIASLTTDVFQHYAYVVDKTAQTIKFYLNGTLEETINLSNAQVSTIDSHTSGNHVRLFHDNSSSMSAAPGPYDKMADFRLFSAALSASDISDLMDDVGSS